MKQISTQELEQFLLLNENRMFIIELQGIINLKMEIKDAHILIKDDSISLSSLEKKSKNISLNKHQIMKIDELDDYVLVHFDFLQTAKILVKAKE